jgi:hypothetical protein
VAIAKLLAAPGLLKPSLASIAVSFTWLGINATSSNIREYE